MPIYKQTTEITNIDDLLSSVERDIEEVYFGDKQVFTVWAEYEGTLPATFSANGDDMRQYQVYGATGGVGDKTENLFDGYFEQGTTASGIPKESGNRVRSNIITAVAGAFNVDFKNEENFDVAFDFWNGGVLVEATSWLSTKNYTTPNNGTSVRIKIRKSNDAPVTPDEVIDFGMYSGSTPPASYEPYGYKLNMAVGSNILQSSEIERGGWQAAVETVPSKIVNPMRCRSKDIYQISGEKIFYDFKSLNVNIAFVDINERSLGGTGFKTGVGSVDVPSNAVKCLFIIANTDTSAYITPAQVIAAGIWAIADATTTPIYIGDEPLDKDEYVDYQAGKIYRMIDGTLTPTDPPVPLPALPTCEGETVVDYAGQSVAPEKAILKYRKKNF